MFCCTLLYVHSSIAIILVGKTELVALLTLYSWCLVMVERLFLAVQWGCLRFVIVVFPDHTHLLFWTIIFTSKFRINIFGGGGGGFQTKKILMWIWRFLLISILGHHKIGLDLGVISMHSRLFFLRSRYRIRDA